MSILIQDRVAAGQDLGRGLLKYRKRADVIVLALPRGGVPVGAEIAHALHAPLDILVVRKLGTPGHEELAMGAIASGGVRVLNRDIVESLGIGDEAIEQVAAREQAELERRMKAYRGERPWPAIEDKLVILVDDGVATGATNVRTDSPRTLSVSSVHARYRTCVRIDLYQLAPASTVAYSTCTLPMHLGKLMTQKSIAPGRPPPHRSKVFQEHVHDTYKSSTKLPTPTLCTECGAIFADGRWRWLPRPESAHSERCPACHRIHDHFPAGYVKLQGEFMAQHRAEVIQLVRNLETREKAEHPLQRVMDIVDEDEGVLITTTDVHLAHGIGEALQHAYKGTLDSHYNPGEKLLRVRWKR